MQKAYTIMMLMPIRSLGKRNSLKRAVPKVMSATLNVVVSINSTTVMQTYWTASSLSRPAPYLCENQFEDSSYKGLNKKELCKKCKRKIKAHEAQPLNKRDMNPKSIVVRIIKKSCNQAHCRNLGSDGCKPAKCSSGAF